MPVPSPAPACLLFNPPGGSKRVPGRILSYMTPPKRKILIPLIAATIIISIFAWNQYQKSQDVNLYLSMGSKRPPVTRLMFASDQGDLEQVQSLLKRGADITLTDGFGWNVLYFAIRGGNHDIVRLLLDADADLNHFHGNDAQPCTLSFAISRAPSSQEDYEFFSDLVNHTPHDLSNHFCNIALGTTTSGSPKYLELFLNSLDPEYAAGTVQGVRDNHALGNNWIKKFEELDPAIQQQLNDILNKYE